MVELFLKTLTELPLLQIFVLILCWGIAEQMGLPITAVVKKLLKINGETHPPKWASELQQNYNHSTSPALEKLGEAVHTLSENIKIMVEQERSEVEAFKEMHSDVKDNHREVREALNQLLRNYK